MIADCGFEVTRRRFLKGAAGATLLLCLRDLAWAREKGDGIEATQRSFAGYEYRSWEDLYRASWRWDRIVKGTHHRANCFSACSWDVYIKDGLVWREEQAHAYGQTNDSLPDFNPRGCQKGGCYSELMYAPGRIKYPMRRVGERGSGRWRRITWEEALDEVAEALLEVAQKEGPECIVYDNGTSHIDAGPSTASEWHFFNLLGATTLDSVAGTGDMPMGALQTWGLTNVDGSSDDWFNSRCIVVWAGNPAVTRIPDFHFMTEARYRGAKLVVVTPDLNATAIHADLWLNVRVGEDAALALSTAQVILCERLYDEEYVREQTDLALLVREDGRFLRQSDLEPDGKEDVFYFWDEKEDKLAEAPGSAGSSRQTLALAGVVPALFGEFQVAGKERKIPVRPLMAVLAERLAKTATPELVAAQTGISPALVRMLAREIASAPSSMIFASWGACKFYHSDLLLRALILVMALTGNQGRPGGGLRTGAWYGFNGADRWMSPVQPKWYEKLALKVMNFSVRQWNDVFFELTAEKFTWTPSVPWLYTHGGLRELMDRPQWNDETLPRPPRAYTEDALEKKWFPLYPPPHKAPRVLVHTGGNPLRRWPAPQVIERMLWPKLSLIVDVDFRMNTTGGKSDILLPAAGYYEKNGIKTGQSYLPYVVVGERALPPLFDSKGEWEIFGLLAKKIQEKAKARSAPAYRGAHGEEIDPKTIYERWSHAGEFEPSFEESCADYILRHSKVTEGVGWREACSLGAVPIKSLGGYVLSNAIASDLESQQPVSPSRWFVERKEPWPTLTGRQQFLIDHDWYREVAEDLPTFKSAPPVGGSYPLWLTGGHTRWSIHSMWRDHKSMLRLERGGPLLFMNPADAKMRGIGDNGRVRLFNDVGESYLRVKLSPAIPPGTVLIYHAWEPFQFANWSSTKQVQAPPAKPIHLLGGFGHLGYRFGAGATSLLARGIRVDVEEASLI